MSKSTNVAMKLDFNFTGGYLTCHVSFVRLNGDLIRRYDDENSELRNITTYAQADKDSRGNNDKPYFYGYDDNEVNWYSGSTISATDAKEAYKTLEKINRKLTALRDELGHATFGEYVLRVAKVLNVENYYREGHNYPISWARDDIEFKLREFAK